MKRLATIVGTILLLSVFSSGAQAQVLIALLLGDKVSNQRFQLGLNVSFAATGLWSLDARLKPSFLISMYGEIRFTERFHLQPELVMKAPGGARKLSPGIPGYSIDTIGDPTYDEVVTTGDVTRDMRYIALPIFVKGVFGPVGLALGPQIAILHTANDTVEEKVNGTKVKVEKSVEGDLQRVDAGIVASVEYAFAASHGMRSMRVRARGYLGLVDTAKDDSSDPVRNWMFSIGLDIPIGGKPLPPDKPSKASQEPPAS